MRPEPEPIRQFIGGYFRALLDAARVDYNTFTMVLFAIFASIAFGVARGLAYATGLYAVLHFLAGVLSSISRSIAHVGDAIVSRNA